MLYDERDVVGPATGEGYQPMPRWSGMPSPSQQQDYLPPLQLIDGGLQGLATDHAGAYRPNMLEMSAQSVEHDYYNYQQAGAQSLSEQEDPVLRQLQHDMGAGNEKGASEYLYTASLVFVKQRTREKYENYKSRKVHVGATMSLLLVTVPAWLLRSPFANPAPLHRLSWILFLFGWILPLLFLTMLSFQLRKMQRMALPGDVTRPYKLLHVRVTALAAVCGVTAMAVQLVARVLSSLHEPCSKEQAHSFVGIFGCNQNGGVDGESRIASLFLSLPPLPDSIL